MGQCGPCATTPKPQAPARRRSAAPRGASPRKQIETGASAEKTGDVASGRHARQEMVEAQERAAQAGPVSARSLL